MSYAFMFPGQGSQSIGMLSDLTGHHDEIAETFAEAGKVLGYDLWEVVRNGPEDRLNRTEVTQPALLAASVATWRALKSSMKLKPEFLAGHSLGEYSALVCAGALEFADAIALVEFRGKAMQQAVPQGTGAMAAILGLDDEVVRTVCVDAAQGQVVNAVNFNSPGQVVIAGQVDAVNRAIELAKEQGAKRAIPLPVSVPSHCELMRPAAEAMRARLEDISFAAPKIPVIHNVDVKIHRDATEIREALVAQLYSPVRWVETVRYMAGEGVTELVECGPGKVLAGLTKRIDRDLSALAVFDKDSFDKALTVLGA